jgi:hypothetical protein
MRERHWQIYGEFCAFRPFPRVPPSPLSNYNQIKDRVFIARHHWRVWLYYARHNIKTQNNPRLADFVFRKRDFFFTGALPTR